MLPSGNELPKVQEESDRIMKSTKRVILADGSRLVREMLHRVIDQAEHLEVVDEVPEHGELPFSIERYDPEWVILSLSYGNPVHGWIDAYLVDYPEVRFVFVSPDQNHIKMRWQISCEKDYSDLSLKEFIDILEKDQRYT
jgi:hypothetical protein